MNKSNKRLAASLLTVSLASLSAMTPLVQANSVKLKTDSEIYMSAGQAGKESNAAGQYKAGQYFVYRRFGNYVNISKKEGVPGGWLSIDKVEDTKDSNSTKPQESSTQASVVETKAVAELLGDKVKLNESVTVHINAADAVNGKNPRGSYRAGEYYVYRTYGDAVNISRFQGAPGGWIYLKEEHVQVPTQEEGDAFRKEEAKKYTLEHTVSGFTNAANAKNANNPVNRVTAGEYYIYREYNGMLNLTKNLDTPGSWVNPEHTDVTKVVRPVSTSTGSSSSSVSNPAPSNASTASGNAVVDAAQNYIGTRYEYGGSSPSGFDCSGFTSYIFRNYAGIDLPRTATGQSGVGRYVPYNELQAGDLVFFNTFGSGVSHVAIYDGNGGYIHATSPENGTRIDSVSSSYWAPRYISARRVLN